MKKRMLDCVRFAAVAGAISLAFMMPAYAQNTGGDNSQLSDRAVDFLKTFVEGFLIPEEIPLKDGSVIKVDRQDTEQMKKFHIPRDDMRRVIRLASTGANAEICDRVDLQENAYKWMKDQEIKKQKWSNEQLFFISRLYIATVMVQTSKAQVTYEGEEVKPVGEAREEQSAPAQGVVCTESKKESVKQLEVFLKEKTKG